MRAPRGCWVNASVVGAMALAAWTAGAPRAHAQAAVTVPADSGRIVAFVQWQEASTFVVGQRTTSPAPGAVRLRPVVRASVRLQGEGDTLGVSRADGYAVLALLPAGRHRLVISAAGYRTLQCRVTVSGGATDTLEVRLAPAESVPGFNTNAYGCRQPR